MPKCLYASTSSEATQHSTKDCVRVEYDRTAFAWDYQTTIPSRIWALPGASPRHIWAAGCIAYSDAFLSIAIIANYRTTKERVDREQ